MLESFAVILLLIGIIALLMNYANGGTARVGQWLKAKYVGSS